MDSTMEQLKQFAIDQWYILLIAAIVLIIIIKIVKTMIKWVLVLIVAAAVVIYGANYIDTIKEVGTDVIRDVGGQLLQYAKEEALEVMIGEAKEAQYIAEADGRFKVQSRNIEIRGTIGDDEVEVTFKGQSVKFKMNDTIRQYIEQAKEN